MNCFVLCDVLLDCTGFFEDLIDLTAKLLSVKDGSGAKPKTSQVLLGLFVLLNLFNLAATTIVLRLLCALLVLLVLLVLAVKFFTRRFLIEVFFGVPAQ